MPLPIAAIISGLCGIAPTIARWLGGDDAEKVTTDVIGIAKTVTGVDDEQAALDTLRKNPEMALVYQQAIHSYDIQMQQELTKRHQADMISDSWLSKNVRPLCLLLISLGITIGVYLPDEYASPEKFKAITDLGVWLYGYYFVGRSAGITKRPVIQSAQIGLSEFIKYSPCR